MVAEVDIKEGSPLGITVESMRAFKSGEKMVKVHNRPVRDVDAQDIWDFMSEGIPGEDGVFEPEVAQVFREVLA